MQAEENLINKLRELALSDNNTHMSRMQAISIIAYAKSDNAYDALVDIASKGMQRSERLYALDLLEKFIRKDRGEERAAKSEKRASIERRATKVKAMPKTTIVVKDKEVKGELSEENFNHMLEQIRPLLASNEGYPESKIKEQFGNMKASVVEEFLSKALKKGIIRQLLPDRFTLAT